MIIGSFYPTANHRRPKIAKQQTRLRHSNHRITDNGHYICGFQRKPDGYSGRVIEDGEGNWLPVPGYAAWDKQGQAIDHEFGNLVRMKNSNDSHN